jgi:phage gp36-like protein
MSATKFVTYKPNKRPCAVKPKAGEEQVCEKIRQVYDRMVAALTRLACKLTEEDLAKMTEDRRLVVEQVKRARELVEKIQKAELKVELAELEAEVKAELKAVLEGLKGKLGKNEDKIHEAAVSRVVYLKPGTMDDLVTAGKCTTFVGADGEYKLHLTTPRSLIIGAAGGNGQPQVPMDDLEAIVSCDAQNTKENYARASEVHGTPLFVHTTITALCSAADAVYKMGEDEPVTKEHMQKVLNALTFIREAYVSMVAAGVADADETTVVTLLHLAELRTQQTPVWQTWPLFSARLLQAACEEAAQSMSETRVLESMRALAEQMHKIVDKMREGVRDAGAYEYFVMMPEKESGEAQEAQESAEAEMAQESVEEEQMVRMSSASSPKRGRESTEEPPREKRQQRGRESTVE